MIAARESPRLRRLRNDHKAMQKLRAESSIFDFQIRAASADPPHEYLVRFHGNGAWRPSQSADVMIRDFHEVSIRLGANYPRAMPELAWRTPIFHPNVSSSGVVCLGGYGTFWAPSLNLDELCSMLWDMVRYDNYDVQSPYNREAALWARTQTQFRLPLDARPLRNRIQLSNAADLPPGAGDVRRVEPTVPEIRFLGEVVECDVIEAEIVEADDRRVHSVLPPVRQSPSVTTRPDDILIIE